jgi:hypothetical protein
MATSVAHWQQQGHQEGVRLEIRPHDERGESAGPAALAARMVSASGAGRR